MPGTRKNPAQTGETVETTYQGATFLVTLREVITGDRAAELVAPGNPSEQLQEGQEYLLFYTVARIVSVPGEEAVHVGSYLWSLVDASGEIHESNFLFGPSPSFTGQGYEGATIDGWSVFARNVGEPIFLVFGLSIEGTGGAWFAVPKEPPPATVITPARAEAPSEPTP